VEKGKGPPARRRGESEVIREKKLQAGKKSIASQSAGLSLWRVCVKKEESREIRIVLKTLKPVLEPVQHELLKK